MDPVRGVKVLIARGLKSLLEFELPSCADRRTNMSPALTPAQIIPCALTPNIYLSVAHDHSFNLE